jgi:glycine/D-amino acid oxidase-like deaminating enzyme/nitrite reductase/ring-hydroxylating ferredoxin subunit
MNVGDERSRSCWMDQAPPIRASALDRDVECDVAVVGAGIAGLSTAYELSRAGRTVVVIDRGEIGRGMTARTTAHLTTEVDDRYSDLVRARGEDEARLYHESQVAAVDRIETIAREEGIDCDFARLDGYLFAAEESHRKILDEEHDSCRTLGVPVEWADRAAMPGRDSGRALRFPDQARFHPLKYLAGLAGAIEARGGRLFAHTAYDNDEEQDGRVTLSTVGGPTIRAGAAVFATNSPVNNKVTIHPKQVPYRTYVIAGRAPADAVPDALVWDTWQTRGSDEFYHYVRLQPLGHGEVLLIAGGEDHRSGEADDMEARFKRLEDWTRERWPGLGEVEFRWSGQVLETIDFMPFSGRNPGSDNVYLHTGDSGIGIVNGVAGALTIAPLILGQESRFAALLDPGRKSITSIPTLREYASGQAGVIANYTEYVRGGDVGSVDALKPGEGAVVREGLNKVAAFRRDDGTLVRRSAVCTHMGCIVQWNPFERCWDCPCHGSQFAAEGDVLNGPATASLERVENQKAPEEEAQAATAA